MKNSKAKKHYVLVNADGKQASRTDQKQLALLLVALNLDDRGFGGGIVEALLSSSPISRNEIRKLADNYTTKLVKNRGGESVNQICRKAVEDNDFMTELVILFDQKAPSSSTSRRAIVREFSNWISAELENPESQAYQLTESIYPDLTEASRSSGWWEKQIASRRKTAS